MRCRVAVLAISCFLALLPAGGLAAPLSMDEVVPEETPEQLCDRLAPDPFAGFGPDEWARPFGTVDFYRALPACTESMKQHPEEHRFVLGAAVAYVAGKKNDDARKLLDRLIAEGNTSAMLVLAYISPESEAAPLMRKAADAGNAHAMMLYGVALMTGKGVSKNPIDGVRMIRRAAEAGSTRAMLILANFYNQGAYGVGLNPAEAKSLISRAAGLGDPVAKDVLASLNEAKSSGTEQQ